MKKLTEQRGYVLASVLLLLSCTLVWGSLLLLSMSDQYAASDDLVRQEQSRLLTRSGWNLALAQLEQTGSLDTVQMDFAAGTTQAVMEQEESGLIRLKVESTAAGYSTGAQGVIQLTECLPEELETVPDEAETESMGETTEPVEPEKAPYYQVQVLDCVL